MVNRKIVICRFTFILIVICVVNCVPYIKKRVKRNLVRVAIECGVDCVNISGIKDNSYYQNYRVLLNDEFPIYFLPTKNGVLVNGKSYRGTVELKNIGGQIWVINVLDIEDYLKGVVPCEIGKISKNLLEAAKAQAVAARTYAYAHLNQYEELGFDLYATCQDQVYEGIIAEDELTNLAVDRTRGEILTFRKKPIEAKYSSTCGGRTADFNDAWPGNPPAYLRSVKCPYCKDSPHYHWRKVLSKKDFFSNLRVRLKKCGVQLSNDERIKKFKLVKNRKTKRVVKLIITTNKDCYIIPSYHLRTVLGDHNDPGGILRSNLIDIKSRGNKIIIEGKGYGHGVGMCQFGAIEMARRGKGYKKILRHYYPGTRIEKTK